MTWLVALLGGVRASVFAGLLLTALAWGAVQAHRVGTWQDKAADVATKLATANDRIEGFRLLLVQVNAAADQQVAQAKAQIEAGNAQAARVAEDAARLASTLKDTKSRLEAAKADPTCAEQLKVKLCSAIPLL